MTVSSVQGGNSPYTTTTATNEDLGMSQFMSLLVTQIQNQDPFSPMDNQQFISQLTQFTSLEQLQKINDSLTSNMTVSQSLNNTLLLDLVGRRATVPGSDFALADGEVSPLKVQAATGGTATITVKNAAGQVVSTYDRQVTAGWDDVTWDGRLADGSVAPDGEYSYAVSMVDRSGTAVATNTFVTGLVDSLRFDNGIAMVTVAGHEYYVSEIAQVSR
ncbi:MAG: flagellar hook assembly protein FlgD [Candidatus Krumholzibacteriia bacterium]